MKHTATIIFPGFIAKEGNGMHVAWPIHRNYRGQPLDRTLSPDSTETMIE